MNLSYPVFDLSILEEMEDDNFIIEVVELYLKDAPKIILQLKNLALENNKKGLEVTAHKLKGSTCMLQAVNMLAVLEKIEEFSKSDLSNSGYIEDLITQLDEQYKLLEQALIIKTDTLKK